MTTIIRTPGPMHIRRTDLAGAAMAGMFALALAGALALASANPATAPAAAPAPLPAAERDLSGGTVEPSMDHATSSSQPTPVLADPRLQPGMVPMSPGGARKLTPR